jgi:hypothetical protein
MRSRLLLLIFIGCATAHAEGVEAWSGDKQLIRERQQEYVLINGERYLVQRCRAGVAPARYALSAGKPPSIGLKAGRGAQSKQICLAAEDAHSNPVAADEMQEH